jgi:hypothetical protein
LNKLSAVRSGGSRKRVGLVLGSGQFSKKGVRWSGERKPQQSYGPERAIRGSVRGKNVRVNPVHITRLNSGSGGIAPLILNLGTR